MRSIPTLRKILAAAGITLALALSACDNKPFEKAGKAIDRGMEKTGDKIKDATKD